MVSHIASNNTSTIYEKLRAAIIAGELAGGTPLRQSEIGARYGVSKIPVREALRQLEVQGFVKLYPNRGAVVTSLSAVEAEEIYLMRIALEPLLLVRSAPLLTEMDYARATAALTMMETIQDLPPADWHDLDGEFHGLLYGAAQLPRLQRQVGTLRDNLARYFGVFKTMGQDFRTTGNKEHREILAACQSGKLELASDILTQHMKGSADRLLAALEENFTK